MVLVVVFLCRQACCKVCSHTQKKEMRGQRMRHKIANREGRAFEVCLDTCRTGAYVEESEGTERERIGMRHEIVTRKGRAFQVCLSTRG